MFELLFNGYGVAQPITDGKTGKGASELMCKKGQGSPNLTLSSIAPPFLGLSWRHSDNALLSTIAPTLFAKFFSRSFHLARDIKIGKFFLWYWLSQRLLDVSNSLSTCPGSLLCAASFTNCSRAHALNEIASDMAFSTTGLVSHSSFYPKQAYV